MFAVEFVVKQVRFLIFIFASAAAVEDHMNFSSLIRRTVATSAAVICLTATHFSVGAESLPEKGVIANYVTGSPGSVDIPLPGDFVVAEGHADQTIVGSVSSVDDSTFVARVENRHETPYYVSLKIESFDVKGHKKGTDRFSATLDGNESAKHEFRQRDAARIEMSIETVESREKN